jgi:hypothetical protein
MNRFIPSGKFRTKLYQWAVGLLFILCILYYFVGIPRVPFHPDESTYLFMGSDIIQLFTNPSSLFWQSALEANARQHYREMDAPITRDLIGAGLLLGGYTPLDFDWNWSKSWQENILAGALPDFSQLLIGRFSVAWLFPISLVLLFFIGKQLKQSSFGVLAAVLFASNALILLHTRRAMEESTLVFGVCITIWGLFSSENKPWIAILGAVLAFNAKQSAIALVPVVLLAICWPFLHPLSVKRIIIRSVAFLVVFTALTFLFNPFLFNHPIQAAQAALKARQSFISKQVEAFQSVAPDQVIYSPGERILAMIAQFYILPPSVEDIGNYQLEISLTKASYFEQPGMDLFRGFIWGSISIGLTLFGIVLSVVKIFKHGLQREKMYVFLLLAFFLQILVLIITIPIPYQRYWIPLIPFTCIWTSIALFEMSPMTRQLLKSFHK